MDSGSIFDFPMIKSFAKSISEDLISVVPMTGSNYIIKAVSEPDPIPIGTKIHSFLRGFGIFDENNIIVYRSQNPERYKELRKVYG